MIRCELCGGSIKTDESENYLEEVGEFWDESKQDSVLAHAQCGLNADLPLA